MLRASRSAAAEHIRILLHQLLFFHRVRIAARRLEEQLDETLDDLHDLGFDGQLLSNSAASLRGATMRCKQQSNASCSYIRGNV